jgi:hypothetical protein
VTWGVVEEEVKEEAGRSEEREIQSMREIASCYANGRVIGDETDVRIGRILHQIKEEREQEEKKKERKKTACERLWITLDPLMQLDNHKFH